MKIKKIYEFLNLIKETKKLNEGFYAYHCTRAQIEEFDDSHDNASSGAGAFWGPGTYFEMLDRDGNFSDYGDESVMSGYKKGKGQQYKVYVDLKPEQILDTTKSFNDFGLKFSIEESLQFILKSSLIEHDRFFYKDIKEFFKLKKKYNNFNDIISKRKSLPYLMEVVNDYISNLQNATADIKVDFNFKKILNNEDSKSMYDVKQYSEVVADILGENDYSSEKENEIREKLNADGYSEAAILKILSTMDYLGNIKKVERLISNYVQLFFKIIKISLNKLPMYIFLKWRTTHEDIKWFMKNLGVYGKIVPERGLNDSNPRRYLIMWKTTGLVKKVGERYKKSEKFTDEIEDEAQDEEIDNMLQYAGS